MLQLADENRIGGPKDGTGFPAAHVLFNTDRVLGKQVPEIYSLLGCEIKSAPTWFNCPIFSCRFIRERSASTGALTCWPETDETWAGALEDAGTRARIRKTMALGVFDLVFGIWGLRKGSHCMTDG